jgi:hypothetical protein
MSRHAYVFVGADRSFDEVAAVVGDALGGMFTVGPDGDLLLMLPGVAVNIGAHYFADGDLADDEGGDIPLASALPCLIEVRDLDKNYSRQNEVASRVFSIARASGWQAVALDDMVDLLGVYLLRAT